jgi:site-specific recombinase XerD
MTAIAPLMTAFLQDYLPHQRGASPHTRDTYADSFRLLFEFARQQLKIAPSAMQLEQIDAPLILGFLDHLEHHRANTVRTRNLRLAAVKAFFRFVEHRLPAALEQIHRILAIPVKKTDWRLVPYFRKEEIEAILDAPDPRTRDGIRDRAMLHLAVTTGIRVSELLGVCLTDVSLGAEPSIVIQGKGRKQRVLPLWRQTTSALRAWLAVRGEIPVPELFVNARGEKLTRWGFDYILKKHAGAVSQRCPSLLGKKVSPHVLRHTCAMVVLQATGDLRKVALWLGHESIHTTEIYTRTDPTEKLEAINAIVPPKLRKGVYRPEDKLLAMLRAERLCGVKSPQNATVTGSVHHRLYITGHSP